MLLPTNYSCCEYAVSAVLPPPLVGLFLVPHLSCLSTPLPPCLVLVPVLPGRICRPLSRSKFVASLIYLFIFLTFAFLSSLLASSSHVPLVASSLSLSLSLSLPKTSSITVPFRSPAWLDYWLSYSTPLPLARL